MVRSEQRSRHCVVHNVLAVFFSDFYSTCIVNPSHVHRHFSEPATIMASTLGQGVTLFGIYKVLGHPGTVPGLIFGGQGLNFLRSRPSGVNRIRNTASTKCTAVSTKHHKPIRHTASHEPNTTSSVSSALFIVVHHPPVPVRPEIPVF